MANARRKEKKTLAGKINNISEDLNRSVAEDTEEKDRTPSFPMMFSKEKPTIAGRSIKQFSVLGDTGATSSVILY